MRSPREILFRLRQETHNMRLALLPPEPDTASIPLSIDLPDPAPALEEIRGTEFGAGLIRLADTVLAHQFQIGGVTIETGPAIHWRQDYVSGRSSGIQYFRRIPYLRPDLAGDHKVIWDLNRHQHLVTLAQAWKLTGRAVYFDEIAAQLESWWAANPFQRSMNWTSALEVALRALSWIWIYHFTAPAMSESFRRRFLVSLCQHGHHLEHNLSFYFSRNTHLLGEAVALHAIGRLFANFPRAGRWRALGHRTVVAEIDFQVHPDGGYFEQSSYYHVYALDMFLFHQLLADPLPAYRERLRAMAGYLHTLLGPGREIPLSGDDDGGRFFHPYGEPLRHGRATLASCAMVLGESGWPAVREDLYPQAIWWLPVTAWREWPFPAPGTAVAASACYPATGIASLTSSGRVQILLDAGPFGPGRAGHSHADTLSIVVRDGGQSLLIDPGTYTYASDGEWRNWFRSTAAHNTVQVNGAGQAEPSHMFGWSSKPETGLVNWQTSAGADIAEGFCRYRGIEHRRWLVLQKPSLLFILDRVSELEPDSLVEQFWHAGQPVEPLPGGAGFRIGGRAELWICGPPAAAVEQGWRSPAFGVKVESPVIRVVQRAGGTVYLGAVLALDGGLPEPPRLIHAADRLEIAAGSASAVFPLDGPAYLPAISR